MGDDSEEEGRTRKVRENFRRRQTLWNEFASLESRPRLSVELLFGRHGYETFAIEAGANNESEWGEDESVTFKAFSGMQRLRVRVYHENDNDVNVKLKQRSCWFCCCRRFRSSGSKSVSVQSDELL